jgi:hypothetical protein
VKITIVHVATGLATATGLAITGGLQLGSGAPGGGVGADVIHGAEWAARGSDRIRAHN